MSHTFKDHSREHQIMRDSISSNVQLINRYTTELQKDIGELQELVIIASWYIGDEQIEIDEHFADAPLDHLKKINNVYGEYCGELVNMDTTIRQLIFIMNKYFNFNDEEMKCVSERVQGDK